MIVQFSNHAKNDRLNNRLISLVSENETLKAIRQAESTILQCREYAYIIIKKFDKRIYITDETNGIVNADTPKGDIILAKVTSPKNGIVKVITVMLRKSSSISERYNNY